MPQQGRLTDWNDDRGFGYIKPLDGSPTVFVHISAFPRDRRRPYVTDLLTYETASDDNGRTRAVDVRFLSAAGARTPRRVAPPVNTEVPTSIVMTSGAFLLLVAVLAASGAYAWYVPLGYIVLSALTFVAYAQDKQAAQRGDWRTGEGTLILLGVIGGWPGALVAQEALRHKTKKQPFRSIFWVSIFVNLALLALLAASRVLTGIS